MKARRREQDKRDTLIGTAAALILIVIIITAGFFVYQSTRPTNTTPEPDRVAIVDQLTLSIPNKTFVDASKKILEDAGYAVDYYKGEQVTVDFYRNLATHGYRLIVLRVHSALYGDNPPLALFTSELYSTTKYINEQLTDQISRAYFNSTIYGDSRSYFGILPGFIKQSMNGNFDNTIIIMMGCDGITYLGGNYRYIGMANAFIERGAKVYISWSGPVLGSHTDATTIHLLRNLITERQPIRKAIENTMVEVGWDPVYKSLLQFYPREAENYAISLVASNLITNLVETKKYDPG